MIGLRRFFLGLALSLGVPAVEAARPMVTDDARITSAGTCQLESWFRQDRLQRELWAVPACQLADNWELALGLSLQETRPEGGHRAPEQLQAKYLFQSVDTVAEGLLGFGVAVGAVHLPAAAMSSGPGGSSWLGYAYVPISQAILGGRWVTHLNLGAQERLLDQDNRRHWFPTWGLGGEWAWSERTFLMLETFAQDQQRARWQGGVRYWLRPNRLQLDTTVGQGVQTRGQRFFSVGVRWLDW